MMEIPYMDIFAIDGMMADLDKEDNKYLSSPYRLVCKIYRRLEYNKIIRKLNKYKSIDGVLLFKKDIISFCNFAIAITEQGYILSKILQIENIHDRYKLNIVDNSVSILIDTNELTTKRYTVVFSYHGSTFREEVTALDNDSLIGAIMIDIIIDNIILYMKGKK